VTLFKVLLNAFFHPLRKYPGPFSSAATSLPFIYYRVTGQQVDWVHSLHHRYGEIVRIRPNELSFIKPDTWKDIYGYRLGGGGYFEKDLTLLGPDMFMKPGEPSGILRTATIEDHAKQRRLIAHAFSDRAIKEQEPLLQQYVDLLIKRLRETAATKSRANMMDWYSFTTFDIMADLTFGESMKQLEKGEYSHWVKGVFGSFKIAAFQQIVRQTPGLQLLVNRITPNTVIETRKMHMAQSVAKANRRLATKTDWPDFFTHILKYSGFDQAEDKAPSLEQIHSKAATFMIAGTENTSTLLAGVTYHLLKNPIIMQKLKAEIYGALGEENEMTIQSLARLEYLNWFWKKAWGYILQYLQDGQESFRVLAP
jgi:cytochrome P450